MTTYKQEIKEIKSHNKTITLTNLTPVLTHNERNEIKRKIKQQLYDVFCKYV